MAALRVLQVVGTLDPGGIENWLLAVAQRLDPAQVRLTIACRAPGPFACTPWLESRGIAVLPVLGRSNLHEAWLTLRQASREADAVHAHIGPWSGLAMHAAARAGVPVRITHGHADEERRMRAMGWWRRPYEDLLREHVRTCANRGLAVSRRAAETLFGQDWERDPRRRLQPCGIDLERSAAAAPRAETRARLGLGSRRVIAAAGRLDETKNHRLLVACLPLLPPDVVIMIAGTGPLQAALMRQAEELGVADRLVLLGQRDDVPALLAAADAVAHPSLHEGLGLAVIEAQAAGTPVVVSDGVPGEAAVVAGRVHTQPLSSGAAGWAMALERACALGPCDPVLSRAAVAAGGYDVAAVARRMQAVWGGAW